MWMEMPWMQMMNIQCQVLSQMKESQNRFIGDPFRIQVGSIWGHPIQNPFSASSAIHSKSISHPFLFHFSPEPNRGQLDPCDVSMLHFISSRLRLGYHPPDQTPYFDWLLNWLFHFLLYGEARDRVHKHECFQVDVGPSRCPFGSSFVNREPSFLPCFFVTPFHFLRQL